MIRPTLAVAAAALVCRPSVAQPICEPPQVGTFGHADAFSRVILDGTVAYVLDGPRLRAIDIVDPSLPTPLGELEGLGLTSDHALVGDVLYVADATSIGGGLRVIDVSDPSEPELIRMLDIGTTMCVTAQDGYLYTAHSLGLSSPALRIFDLSDPTVPVETGSLSSMPSLAYDIFVAGDVVYIAANDLLIVDASNPAQPMVLAQLPLSRRMRAVGAQANLLYAVEQSEGLTILDVANPAAPVVRGRLDRPNLAPHVTLFGNSMLVLADRVDGLLVVDAADPALPRVVGQLGGFELAGHAAISGSTLAIAGGWYGLRTINISNPAQPVLLGVLDNVAGLVRSVVRGSLMYGVDFHGNFQVLSIGDPRTLQPMAQLRLPTRSTLQDIHLQGDTAIVASGWLSMLDISDPASPVEAASIQVTDVASRVAVSGSLAYVLNVTDILQHAVVDIVDISSPANLRIIASTPSLAAEDIDAAGSLLYLVGGADGLTILDASNPMAISPISTTLVAPGAREITVRSSAAYVAHGEGLSVFDVTIPETPREVGRLRTPSPALGLDVRGDHAAITHVGSVSLVDLSNAANPRLSGRSPVAHFSRDVLLAGDLAYLLGGTMHLLDISPCTACPADVDADGSQDVFDLLAFLDAWFRADADFDGDGDTTAFDLLLYVDAWLRC